MRRTTLRGQVVYLTEHGERLAAVVPAKLAVPPEPAHQPGRLLIVAITAYWQHVVVDDRACPVVTW